MSDLHTLILDAISHMGDASSGAIAAKIAAPTEEVHAALLILLSHGKVSILPHSLTWALA